MNASIKLQQLRCSTQCRCASYYKTAARSVRRLNVECQVMYVLNRDNLVYRLLLGSTIIINAVAISFAPTVGTNTPQSSLLSFAASRSEALRDRIYSAPHI